MSNDDVKLARPVRSPHPANAEPQGGAERQHPASLDAEQSARLRALLVRGLASATPAARSGNPR